MGKKLPCGEGLYVFSVPMGLAVSRVQVGLRKGFVVTGSGISEELEPMEIDRLLVGRKVKHYRSRPLRCASARENYIARQRISRSAG